MQDLISEGTARLAGASSQEFPPQTGYGRREDPLVVGLAYSPNIRNFAIDTARECPTHQPSRVPISPPLMAATIQIIFSGARSRTSEVMDAVQDHIWDLVNAHLSTSAHSLPELVSSSALWFRQPPCVADTFCGSGQIPFEAARLGCNVYASDINPVACMLTWGAFHIIGGQSEYRQGLSQAQEQLAAAIQDEIDSLRVETDEHGWKPKTFLYCIEVVCPQTGWKVPLLATRLISKGQSAIAELVPDTKTKRFSIRVRSGVSELDLLEAQKGTILTDGRGQEPYLAYSLNGIEYRTKIATLRGDFTKPGGGPVTGCDCGEKRLQAAPDDVYQERLYAIQWMRPKKKGKGFDTNSAMLRRMT